MAGGSQAKETAVFFDNWMRGKKAIFTSSPQKNKFQTGRSVWNLLADNPAKPEPWKIKRKGTTVALEICHTPGIYGRYLLYLPFCPAEVSSLQNNNAMPDTTFKSFSIKIPFLGLEGNWEVDDKQRDAAWEIYIELVTRVTIVELKKDEGILREALNSFYSLFDTTRKILKKYGPSIAVAAKGSDMTLGHVAVGVLNKVLRPLLAKWHPLLEGHESQRPAHVSIAEHERSWEQADALREEIARVRQELIVYADVLAAVSEVSKLH